MTRIWLTLGCLFGGLSVAGGAFGAHALKIRVTPELLEIFHTGTRYAMVHALALVLTGLVAARVTGATTTVAGWSFGAGILLFTGSLWLMTLTGARWLGAITPLGGLCFLAGWVSLGLACWRWPAG
ncbi:MAG: DUF423 domain-containing protein [Oligoflexia bacterium]|nr:DUF423 domain-containing protein [Oligoflexia bacterium]